MQTGNFFSSPVFSITDTFRGERSMKTVSVGIQNLCAPCNCSCRYCLLQSSGNVPEGVTYYRGLVLAKRFAEWGESKNPANIPYYYIGYCAEYPELFENIAYNKSIGFAGASFLQCNGLRLRDKPETDRFVAKLQEHGITTIDTTFYGSEQYHDTFAARKGDYAFMLQFAQSAVEQGMTCFPSVPVLEENKNMLDGLISILSEIVDVQNIRAYLPDYRGRGCLMENSRLTQESFSGLSETVKHTININQYKTEKDWLSIDTLPEYTRRDIIITLRNDNIDMFEKMSCDEIVAHVEKYDDEYYNIIPSIQELAKMYGDKTNTKLYRLRDLFWMWQKYYIAEHHLNIYNVTDERLCSTIRS